MGTAEIREGRAGARWPGVGAGIRPSRGGVGVRLLTLAPLLAMLAACSPSALGVVLDKPGARPTLPDLPAKAVANVPVPVAAPGDDARVVAARAIAALKAEQARKGAIVDTYRSLQRGLSGK